MSVRGRLVLGIESSCDETAAALVDESGLVLSDVIASQVAIHAPYGGVVPEHAARAHLQNVVPVIERALAATPRGFDDVGAIAVTNGPGLAGALLVGVQVAKAIALVRGVPLVGVDHLRAHVLSPFLRRDAEPRAIAFPYVALLVSGGHTALYDVESAHDVTLLGQTRDDAAGEAFDKAAKLLNLGYPGGPRIDALAANGNASTVELPRSMTAGDSLEFSFSGLKTAVAKHVAENPPSSERDIADLCASFQRAVIEVLVKKSIRACELAGRTRFAITGGVACNRGLRAHAASACARHGIELVVPPPASCTDNGAMIAFAGHQRLARGDRDGLDLGSYARSPEVRRGKFA